MVLEHFPSELKSDLSISSLPKYRFLFERLNRIEKQLDENYVTLQMEKAAETKSRQLFYAGNDKVTLGVFKNKQISSITHGIKEEIYLAN